MCNYSGKVFEKKWKNSKCIISDLLRDISWCRRQARDKESKKISADKLNKFPSKKKKKKKKKKQKKKKKKKKKKNCKFFTGIETILLVVLLYIFQTQILVILFRSQNL